MPYLSHDQKFVYIVYELDEQLRFYFVLENCDKIMHLRFNFDACPVHSPFGFVHLAHQNLGVCALFCHNSLAKVNTHLLIYNRQTPSNTCKTTILQKQYLPDDTSTMLVSIYGTFILCSPTFLKGVSLRSLKLVKGLGLTIFNSG